MKKIKIIILYLILVALVSTILLSVSGCENANLPNETTVSDKMETTDTTETIENPSIETTETIDSAVETQKPTVSTEPRVGLEFKLNSDGKSYSVVGIGTCKDTDIVIPAEYNGLSVTKIEAEAFRDCENLISIEIPSTMKSIWNNAFSGCKRLQRVSFDENSQLTSIGEYAFAYCESLTSIEIPSGVTHLWGGAFYDCSSLTSVELPSTVTSIEGIVFRNCSSLESIIVAEGNTVYHSVGNCLIETASKTLIAGCNNSVIPADGSVTIIGESAFAWCDSLTSVEIPSGVTSIEYGAFWGCYSLTNIKIPASVTNIGKDAFYDCFRLYAIYNDSDLILGLNSDYYGEFSRHIKLIVNKYGNKTYLNDGAKYIDTEEGFLFKKKDDNYQLIGYIGSEETVTLPRDIDGNDYEIFDMRGVRNVIIPDNITNIGEVAFRGCHTLERIEIPSNVTSIGGAVFSGCSNLKYNEYDNGLYLGNAQNPYVVLIKAKTTDITSCTIHEQTKVIADSAFFVCSRLTSIEIPSSITSIGGSVFFGCSRLTSINIPSSVTSIEDRAFSGCSSLTSIEIPLSVTSIGDYAFSGCSSLTSIELPSGVTSIGGSAFSGCSSLTSIEIPLGMTSIGSYAFYDCSSLTSIIYDGNRTQWQQIEKGERWNENTSYCTIHYTDEEIKK